MSDRHEMNGVFDQHGWLTLEPTDRCLGCAGSCDLDCQAEPTFSWGTTAKAIEDYCWEAWGVADDIARAVRMIAATHKSLTSVTVLVNKELASGEYERTIETRHIETECSQPCEWCGEPTSAETSFCSDDCQMAHAMTYDQLHSADWK